MPDPNTRIVTESRWPTGLAVEFDDEGQTQDGSIAVKRAFIERFHEAGYEPDAMPAAYAALAKDFPEEFGEVCEEFDAKASAAYR